MVLGDATMRKVSCGVIYIRNILCNLLKNNKKVVTQTCVTQNCVTQTCAIEK